MRLAVTVVLLALSASAAEPVGSTQNLCTTPGGQGLVCAADAQCAANALATRCVSAKCAIPCMTDGPAPAANPVACALGESCVPAGALWVCQPQRFRVDLNLLDRCIAHFLSGIDPVLGPGSACSAEANLSRLLDQNGDNGYDLFDLDLCILAFLERPDCTVTAQPPVCSAPDLVPCKLDADCGTGLYCDAKRNVCQRDCGLVTSREASLGLLDRECSAPLTTCDRTRGRCVKIPKAALALIGCDDDSGCPSGAYCLLGQCAGRCYQSVDCPDNGWYCAEDNKCHAVPPPPPKDGKAFDPKGYAVRFAADALRLSAVADSDATRVVIIDLLTRKQVLDDPSVAFGYRLELTYGSKQDTQCLRPVVDCTDPKQLSGETTAQCTARQADCTVDKAEQFVTLPSPFGVVTASLDARIQITLDTAAAGKLSPGVYPVTLTAYFDNGDRTSVPVVFTKPSPSGEYDGQLSIYLNGTSNGLNGRAPFAFGLQLYVDKAAPVQTWDGLLLANNLATSKDVKDLTEGTPVRVLLHGKGAIPFTRGDATSVSEDEIPFRGLYSPQLGRMRLIGLIEIEADFCIDTAGGCSATSNSEPLVRNRFARKIRRQIEFIGPFDPATRRFSGLYRETITGLAPSAVTFEGGFILDQSTADDTPVVLTAPLAPSTATVSFPPDTQLATRLAADITEHCAGVDPQTLAHFATRETFLAYLAQAHRSGTPTPENPTGATTILPEVVSFKDAIQEALTAMSTAPNGASVYLNVYDFLADRVISCKDGKVPTGGAICVDSEKARCGLALYQKALLNRWVALDDGFFEPDAPSGAVTECPPGQTLAGGKCLCAGACECPPGQFKTGDDLCKAVVAGKFQLFCSDTIDTAGCSSAGQDAPGLLTLQEYARFWNQYAQVRSFDAGRARSDAFLTLYRNAVNAFAQGAALSFKLESLQDALGAYDDIVGLLSDPLVAHAMYAWPAQVFQSQGNDWLKLIQSQLAERLGAVAELVDLQRRIFQATDQSDYMYAEHLVQQEYLTQAWLLALQRQWQQEKLVWSGASSRLFEQGATILAQLNPTKNAVGFTPNRVFFENADLDLSNWEAYRARIVGEGPEGDGGLLNEARETIAEAVQELKASTADLDALETKLFLSKDKRDGDIEAACGSPDPLDPAKVAPGATGTAPVAPGDYCQYLLRQFNSVDEWRAARDCALGSSSATCTGTSWKGLSFACVDGPGDLGEATSACRDAVATFTAATNETGAAGNSPGTGFSPGGDGTDIGLDGPVCELDRAETWVLVHGEQRPCVGGEMGAMIQDKVLLDRQRLEVLRNLGGLLRGMSNTANFASKMEDALSAKFAGKATLASLALALTVAIGIIDVVMASQEDAISAADCIFIAGFAVGTDCIGKAVVAVTGFTEEVIFGAVQKGMEAAIEGLNVGGQVIDDKFDQTSFAAEVTNEILGQKEEVQGLISEYLMLTQESFNLSAQIEDQRFQVQTSIDGYVDEVGLAADHLLGRETGNLLRGEWLVSEASREFLRLRDLAYRMTVAFTHGFNVDPVVAAQLVAKALSVVTVDDVEVLVETLDDYEQQLCGLETFDCDSEHNVETLRLSLRDTLFPGLVDKLDAQGAVLVSKGEQFHNLITSPPFVRRRVRGGQLTDQIELLINIPFEPTTRPGGYKEWTVNPLLCNAVLTAEETAASISPSGQLGTIAVNAIVRGQAPGSPPPPGRALHYQLVRGGTDYLRSCTAVSKSVEFGALPQVSWPIQSFLIGHAPQSSDAKLDAPPSYITTSPSFAACLNAQEQAGSLTEGVCWRVYARDRSLSSLDWKLVVPLRVGEGVTDNGWVTGAGLDAKDKPIVEDIVVYLRYRSRPITEP